MKKHIVCIILTLSLFLSSGFVFAYTIQEGTLSLEGASNAFYKSRNFNHADDYSEYEVDIEAGYFVLSNLELGLSLFYEKTYSDDWDSVSKGISPFISYHLPANDNSNIYVGVGLTFLRYEENSDACDTEQVSAGYFMKAGWEYFLNPKVAMDIGFSIGRIEWDLNGCSESDDKETRFIGPKLGLKVLF